MLLQNKEKLRTIKVITYLAVTIFMTQQQLFTSEIKIKNDSLVLAHDKTCWLLKSTLDTQTSERKISLEEGFRLIAEQQQIDHNRIIRIKAREEQYAQRIRESTRQVADNLNICLNLRSYIKLLHSHHECNLRRMSLGFEPKPLDIPESLIEAITSFLNN